jgi:hypothetical protein
MCLVCTGERCPFEDGNARACFIGISASTTREQMLRAVSKHLLPSYGAIFLLNHIYCLVKMRLKYKHCAMGSVCKQVMEGVAFALRSSCDALAGGELHDSGMCNVLLIPTTVISIAGNGDGNNKGVCEINQSQNIKH